MYIFVKIHEESKKAGENGQKPFIIESYDLKQVLITLVEKYYGKKMKELLLMGLNT